MRAGLIAALLITTSIIFVGCRSMDVAKGPSGSESPVCTQCNFACASGDKCPECKGRLQSTGVAEACPRCNMLCGGSCSVCGISSVPAVRYYRCPHCGKTMPMTGSIVHSRNAGASAPNCPSCKWQMLPQVVPLRAYCPDCEVWGSRPGACPKCGVDMSPR